MGFNSGFKGLIKSCLCVYRCTVSCARMHTQTNKGLDSQIYFILE